MGRRGPDPIGDMSRWTIEFRKKAGQAPNTMVLGAYTMAALKQHPAVIERIKYTQRGIVTEDLIATMFGGIGCSPPMPPSVRDRRPRTPALRRRPLSTTSSPRVRVLCCCTRRRLRRSRPGRGLHLHLERVPRRQRPGHPGQSARMEPIASDRVEAEMTYDQHVVCPDMGVFIADAVA